MALKLHNRRLLMLLLVSSTLVTTILFLRAGLAKGSLKVDSWLDLIRGAPSRGQTRPRYKPAPSYTPPPVRDPFPLLSTAAGPPPIPRWNQPRENLHRDYDLPVAPPLLIGFTRTWPVLLQAVVSYITAGWPPEQIYVVENTGVQAANARGRLTLQNPFYLNHTQLAALGVRVVQAPVLLTFAQLQNFFLHLALARGWPYYFWSHQDVLALSYEDGLEGVTPPRGRPGYKTVYELGCEALRDARAHDDRWAARLFAYDHLALVNPAAYESVGGWDTLIPYYLTDCDMHSRLLMANWTMLDRPAGTITDTSSVLADLRALYRDPEVVPGIVDPNPPAPAPGEAGGPPGRPRTRGAEEEEEEKNKKQEEEEKEEKGDGDPDLDYYWSLRHVSDLMFWAKHGDRGRNTWQSGQHGGAGEPYYYPAEGLAEGIDIITEAGREVYRRKWGHRDCDLISGAGLSIGDQWRVEKDWND